MTIRAFTVAACLSVAHFAGADSAVDLEAKGRDLAKDGRYTDAIDAFKAADQLTVRASHACLIALAYTRRELWPQAEIWLATCEKRALPDDPLPDWFAEMSAQIAQRLATANVAPVEIRVEPVEAAAKLTVSSFPPDETFEPRTIHLPPGHHVIIARAAGYVDGQQALDVADKTGQHVVITLHHPPPPPPPPNRRGVTLLYTGAALVAVDALVYGWMTYEWFQIRKSSADFDDHIDGYRIAKWSSLALDAASATCLIAGYLLHRRGNVEAPAVVVEPRPGGAMVSVGWQR